MDKGHMTEYIKVNLPLTEQDYLAGNGEGVWARQKILCKRRQAVVKETGANQRISRVGQNPA